MFNTLQERLESAFKNLRGQGRITELNVAATIKDIRRALVDADVNFKIAKEFTDTVKDKALGQKVLNAISPGQLMIKIVQDELTALMGGQAADFNAKGNPAVILIAGLQGSGKTTFSGKLANYLKTQKGLQPLLVAADVYRPAAMEQLRVLGGQIDVPVHIESESTDPVGIAQRAVAQARSLNRNVVIIDTAGRLAVDEVLMKEVADIRNAVTPQEILFVVDSMTGQDAENTAKAFNDRNSSAAARKWIRWMCSIPTGWHSESWVWATSPPWWKRPNRSSMKPKPRNWNPRSERTSSILRISRCRSSRSKRWGT